MANDESAAMAPSGGVEETKDVPWTFPTAEEIREELYNEFTKEQKEKVWTEATEAVKTFHDDLVRRWKEEMDTLLVYAGVSSAVLTAFNVESYQLLQPATSDPTLLVLKQISAQLNGYTFAPPFVNATHIATPADFAQAPFQAPAPAVWLNVLWFSSLVFSFASATLALFVKQWIYEAMVAGTSRESARLRQYRLNGLLKWRVGAVVVVLPILLQLSSVLFLAGLLVLLWTLHSTVAVVSSALVGTFFAFFLVATLLPVLRSDCSYRSPASYAIYSVLRLTRNEVLRVLRRACKEIYTWSCQWRTWMDFGRAFFDRLGDFGYTAYDNMATWRGRDQNEIYEQHGALDRAVVTTAYSSTADSKYLASMPIIFSDLPPPEIAMVFLDILRFMEAEWGHWHLPERAILDDPITLPLCAVYGIRHVLAMKEKGSEPWFTDAHVVFRHFFIGDRINDRLAELSCKALCQLAVEDREYRHVYGLACRTLEYMYDNAGARHTYDTLRHAMALYEVEMAAWDPSLGFRSVRDITMAIYILLHCVRAAVSGRTELTPNQLDVVRRWGRAELSRTLRWLRNLEWTGLHKGCIATPGDAAAVFAFPHIASYHWVDHIIIPLTALCSSPGGHALVSEELVSAVERTWASARLAYPDTVASDAGFVWCTKLDCIDDRLAELRTVWENGGRPGVASCTSQAETCIQ